MHRSKSRDLLHTILTFVRLPIESLLRLRCVCKSLCFLISNPSFTTAHIAHQKTANKYSSLLYKFHHRYTQNCKFYLLRFDIDYNDVSRGLLRKDVEWALTDKSKRSRIYGICSGVICFSCDRTAIRKLKILPKSQIHFRAFYSYSLHAAFGFLPNINNYKVVRIVYFSRRHRIISSEVEVYSISADSWKKVGVNSAPLCFLYDTVQFVNVTAYW